MIRERKMTREEALDSIKANVDNTNSIKHMLATEAIMQAMAKYLGEDEEEWGLTGLLHDIDVELTQGNMHTHSKLGADLARELGANAAVVHAILCHNDAHGILRKTKLDKALFCVDPLTDLITAAALICPNRKLASLDAKSVIKKFKQKGFAAGANRQQIAQCSEIGIEFDHFVELGLVAMQAISRDLGL
jgi:putative nucleotidyltransferase with HDIG domain